MGKKKSFKKAFANALEIPADIATGQLKLTLKGKEAVFLENHRGIITYSPQKILCQTEEGLLEIRGGELLLESLGTDELFIQGEIRGIAFSFINDENA